MPFWRDLDLQLHACGISDAAAGIYQLMIAGFTTEQLKRAGFTPLQFQKAAPLKLQKAGFTIEHVRSATGCTLAQLQGVGFTLPYGLHSRLNQLSRIGQTRQPDNE